MQPLPHMLDANLRAQWAAQDRMMRQQAIPSESPQGLAQTPATSSLNVAIIDMKDFPSDVVPTSELYSELLMSDGQFLFECKELVKQSGIDLMNCPLIVTLKVLIKRRILQGPMVLWHVLLPLPLFSKHLLQPPHEWEMWIGVFPAAQRLEDYTPDIMFAQSVQLLSRPDCPKLRLRFRYHNPEHQAQLAAEIELRSQAAKQQLEARETMGQLAFQEVSPFARSLRRGVAGSEVSTPHASEHMPADSEASSEGVQRALQRALAFVDGVHALVAASEAPPGATPLPPRLGCAEVLASYSPALLVEDHCEQLHRRLRCALPPAGSRKEAVSGLDQEPMLVEGLRMALMGIVGDSDSGKVPRTTTNLSANSGEQLASIRARFPTLWTAYCEVSCVAKERAALIEQVNSLNEANRDLEKLLQQRQAAVG